MGKPSRSDRGLEPVVARPSRRGRGDVPNTAQGTRRQRPCVLPQFSKRLPVSKMRLPNGA